MEDKEKIENIIKSDEVVVFMKGTPDFPQCGFSANVIGILNYFNIKFTSFNVLEDNLIREGIKNYSNWPYNFNSLQPVILLMQTNLTFRMTFYQI